MNEMAKPVPKLAIAEDFFYIIGRTPSWQEVQALHSAAEKIAIDEGTVLDGIPDHMTTHGLGTVFSWEILEKAWALVTQDHRRGL